MSEPASEVTARIWRGGADGAYRDYRLGYHGDQTVLDLVTEIQRRHDPTLAYRFSCRVGMCGSCAMMVSGRPRWTCRTLVADVVKAGRLTLAPLANLPVIRDLVADMTPFFDKWREAGGRFEAGTTAADDFAPITPDDPARQLVDAGIECINCGICHAACDVVRTTPSYLGPAALNRAWTLVNDARDQGGAARLARVAAGGCLSCHTHQACAQYCPKGLNPTRAIAGLKRAIAKAALGGTL